MCVCVCVCVYGCVVVMACSVEDMIYMCVLIPVRMWFAKGGIIVCVCVCL